MVYYRKYRPQKIADLASASLRETLFAVLGQPSIPHAFLFTGPKGLGKTSTARIVAKAVNCEHPDAHGEPDNTCAQCLAITNGTSMDVLEIDGASNRGIDEIRDLRERVNLAPSSAKKKVYIIDEVHMLTTEAFNALLKTIEEPPAHVIFIFCTTEPHKVPATILSRCFHISFALATESEIVNSLERIVIGEKIDIEKEGLHTIAKLADGGFRDAAKMLEEVVSLASGQKITHAFVEEKLHVGSVENIKKLIDALSTQDTKKGLECVNQLVEQGTDIKFFLLQLIRELHGMLLERFGIASEAHAQIFTVQQLQDLLSLFSQALVDMKVSIVPQLPLEMAIVAFTQEIVDNQSFSSSGPTRSYVTGKHTMHTLLAQQQNQKIRVILGKEEVKKPAQKPKPDHTQENLSHASNDGSTLMENIIYKVKPINYSLAGVLRSCKVVSEDTQKVIIEAGYKFHKEKLEERSAYEIIEKAIREITGKPLQVQVMLKS